MGFENIWEQEVIGFNHGIRTSEDLQYWMNMVGIKPAEAYKILHTGVIKNRKLFLEVFCLRHFGSHDTNVFLKAVKANGAARVFYEEDTGKALKEFEKRTYYKRPKKIKTFEKDLTTLRKKIGTKRAYNDGAFRKKRLEEAKDRIARKKFKGKR